MAMQKCPVCEGRGNVPVNFYTRATMGTRSGPIQCQTCRGRGIISDESGSLIPDQPFTMQTGTNPNPDGFRYFDNDADRWDWWNRRGEVHVTFNPPFDYIIMNVEDA